MISQPNCLTKVHNYAMLPFLSVVLGSLILVGCEDGPLPENTSIAREQVSKTLTAVSTNGGNEIIITNIVRVFFHEPPTHYSAMSMGASNRLVFHDLRMNDINIFVDVPPDEPMWIVYNDTYRVAEIHIHSPHDINGAGWAMTRGKSTAFGTTVEVR